ncbi:MAG: L-sorbosone dehydrogenase, partial [Planctomycetota bacterium]
RQQVIQALGAFDSESAHSALTKLATNQDPETRISATVAIATRRPVAAVPLIVALFDDQATADAATNLIANQVNRKQMPERFAAALSDRHLDADRARELLRRVRVAGGNTELEQAIQTAGQLDTASWKLTPDLQRDILARVRDEGDAQRGQAIYRREKLQCIQCHAIGVGGGLVGPNLISIGGSSQADYILESLLNPSAKLKEGYTTLSVLTVDGDVANGIAMSRTEQIVRLRLATGKEMELSVDDIEQEKPGKSLMPDGLLDSLTKAELVDLTTFLVALGRDPDFTVSTEPIARRLETLVYSNEANRRLNRTSIDTAASDDPVMNWRSITTLVDGSVPVSELDTFKQHRETPPTSFVRFRFELPTDGTARLKLPTEGIEAWVDGKPTPVWDLKTLALKRGKHQVVLAIDRSTRRLPFKIQVDGEAVLD